VYILKEIKKNKTTKGFFDFVEDFAARAISIIKYKNDYE
tara:strand:- start:774 stop:890 length:117 start_codon:yes stop_codon:yes gene_type:complete